MISISLLGVFAVLPPVIGQLRGASPSALLALAGLGLFGVAVLLLAIQFGWPIQTALFAQSRAYNDTYYVVGHAHYIAGAAFVLAILWGLLRMNERSVGNRTRSILRLAVWGVLVSIYGTLAVQGVLYPLLMPQRYIDFPGMLAPLNTTSIALWYLGCACAAALVFVSGAVFVGRIGRG